MSLEDNKDQAKKQTEQELAFAKKYGSIKPTRQLIARGSKYFDSADWAMERNKASFKAPSKSIFSDQAVDPTPDPNQTENELKDTVP